VSCRPRRPGRGRPARKGERGGGSRGGRNGGREPKAHSGQSWVRGTSQSAPRPAGCRSEGTAAGGSMGSATVTHFGLRRKRPNGMGPLRPLRHSRPGPAALAQLQQASKSPARPLKLPLQRPPQQRGCAAAHLHPPSAALEGAAVARKRALGGSAKSCRRPAGALPPPVQWGQATTVEGGAGTAKGRARPTPAAPAGSGSHCRQR